MTDVKEGWAPPVIYDPATDTSRAATQADVDELVKIARAYGRLRSAVRLALEEGKP